MTSSSSKASVIEKNDQWRDLMSIGHGISVSGGPEQKFSTARASRSGMKVTFMRATSSTGKETDRGA